MRESSDDKDKTKLSVTKLHLYAISSIYMALILSIIIYGIYHFSYMVKHLRGRHSLKSFIFLFFTLTISLFLTKTMIPDMYNNFSTGIGWGIGSAVVYNVLR